MRRRAVRRRGPESRSPAARSKQAIPNRQQEMVNRSCFSGGIDLPCSRSASTFPQKIREILVFAPQARSELLISCRLLPVGYHLFFSLCMRSEAAAEHKKERAGARSRAHRPVGHCMEATVTWRRPPRRNHGVDSSCSPPPARPAPRGRLRANLHATPSRRRPARSASNGCSLFGWTSRARHLTSRSTEPSGHPTYSRYRSALQQDQPRKVPSARHN
jgi:hypothetical protein